MILHGKVRWVKPGSVFPHPEIENRWAFSILVGGPRGFYARAEETVFDSAAESKQAMRETVAQLRKKHSC